MLSDDLTALIFELQRAPSPKDKAKALARAWRTVRGLKPTERRLLAREVGFDGAEDLIEGLSGRERGVFAPAAVLEALGKMRSDPDFSVRRILNDLGDPDRRDDLLVRGMDLVADSVAPEPEGEIEIDHIELPDGNVWMVEDEDSRDEGDAGTEVAEVVVPDPPMQDARPQPVPQPVPELKERPQPSPEPEPEPTPSVWDVMAMEKERKPPEQVRTSTTVVIGGGSEIGRRTEAEGSVMERLRRFHDRVPALGGARVAVLADELDAFPEPWARRRALTALIDADVPDDAAGALDLIEGLDRPADRRWCLSALARRGDLAGNDLDRALGMLISPAAKRRVRALAAR